jgi:hypothetical protein
MNMASTASTATVLIYLGANASPDLEARLAALCPGTKFVESAVYPERTVDSSAAAQQGDRVQFDASVARAGGRVGLPTVSDGHDLAVINKVLNDKLIPLLWTRFGGKFRWRHLNEVKRFEVACALVKAALSVCRQERPRKVIFAYEPHMVPMYLFKKVCEALGVETVTLVVSPFNWRLFVDEVGSSSFALPPPGAPVQAHASVARFTDEKRSDYSVAKPFYENRKIRKGALGRLLHFGKVNRWAPHRVVPGWRLRNRYAELTSPRAAFERKPYVCLFLQFQPEQTTLPDGGVFAHQLLAIQLLHAAIAPLGLALVIREHPATFEYAFDAKWRPGDFYDTIRGFGPDIHFDELSAEPYSLIRSAKAVCAITGTVLLEGLLQGRAAVAFGKHPLKGLKMPAFVDQFDDEVDLREKLRLAMTQPQLEVITQAEAYLHRVYPGTFGASEYVGNANMTLDLLRQARNQALCDVVSQLAQRVDAAKPMERACKS